MHIQVVAHPCMNAGSVWHLHQKSNSKHHTIGGDMKALASLNLNIHATCKALLFERQFLLVVALLEYAKVSYILMMLLLDYWMLCKVIQNDL